MGNELFWIFDVVTVVIVVVCIYLGGKSGLLKSVVLIVGYLFAMIGGFLFAKALSPAIYDTFLHEKVYEIVEENIDKLNVQEYIKKSLEDKYPDSKIDVDEITDAILKGGDVADNLAETVKDSGVGDTLNDIKKEVSSIIKPDIILSQFQEFLPKSIMNVVQSAADESKDNMSEILSSCISSNKHEASESISKLLIKPIVTLVITILLWVVIFIVLMLVVKLLAGLFGKFYMIPILGKLNTLGGAILGVVKGLVWVFVVALLVKFVVSLSNGELLVLNEETIQNTILFKYIYNFKI